MNLKKIESKGIWNYIMFGSGQFVNLLAPLLIAPYVISICGIELWGKIGVATSVFLILSIFIDFGSQLIGVKEISSDKNNIDYIRKYLNITYAFRFLVLLLILFFLILFLFLFPNFDFKLYSLGLWALIAQFFNPIWVYIGNENFKRINKIIIISKAIYIFLVYLIIKQKSDYIYAIFLLGISNTIVYSYYYLKIFKSYNMSLLSVTRNELIDNLKREYPFVISSLSISVYTNSPILIVKFVLGDYYAGIYKIGDMILNIFRSYLSVFFNVSFPKFCSIYSENKSEGIVFLKKASVINLLLLSVGILSVIIISNTDLINNMKYDLIIFYYSGFVLVPFVIALNIPFYQLLIYNNEQKTLSKIFSFCSILMLFLCYFLTKNFNLIGSLISVLVIEIIITILKILNCSIIRYGHD